MAQAPKKASWGVEADTGSVHSVPGELGWLAASLDGLGSTVLRTQERVDEISVRLAATATRVDSLASREDVQRLLSEHMKMCWKPNDPAKLAKALGIVLAAIGALIGAFAAAWAVTPH